MKSLVTFVALFACLIATSCIQADTVVVSGDIDQSGFVDQNGLDAASFELFIEFNNPVDTNAGGFVLASNYALVLNGSSIDGIFGPPADTLLTINSGGFIQGQVGTGFSATLGELRFSPDIAIQNPGFGGPSALFSGGFSSTGFDPANLTVNSNVTNFFAGASTFFDFNISNVTIGLAPDGVPAIPEPSSMGILAMVGLVGLRRRRR